MQTTVVIGLLGVVFAACYSLFLYVIAMAGWFIATFALYFFIGD